MKRIHHQRLPVAGVEREALREKGQFWTPQWVAEAMVAYVIGGGAHEVFDPAVGAGAFFTAAKSVATKQGRPIELSGAELDPSSLEQARLSGLSADDLKSVEIRDFVTRPPAKLFEAVVANPPYIRHHRLSEETKAFLRRFGSSVIGRPLDGRAGYHVYFFLRGLRSLSKGGRLAFIMPADVCEGVFAQVLWQWILSNYRLDAVTTFDPAATPFPGVDTNPIIFMLCAENPQKTFHWAKCLQPDGHALEDWVASDFSRPCAKVQACTRLISEALQTGLSRPPCDEAQSSRHLRAFASVLRGIATGGNDFFFLTKKRATELNIPSKWLVPAVGRTRDVQGTIITPETMEQLEAKGRPTLLLSLDASPLGAVPESVRNYIRQGERLGLHKLPLIMSRKPWYKMEVREAPPFLFAYLGRRNARFIRNLAGVVPLTGFLCVYPSNADPSFIDRLWHVLSDPETVSNLALVGKSYGAGAIKVEPRALERLPIPVSLLERYGLDSKQSPKQLHLSAV